MQEPTRGKRYREDSSDTETSYLAKRAKSRRRRNTLVHEPKPHQLRYYPKIQQHAFVGGKLTFRVDMATKNGFPSTIEAQECALKCYRSSCKEINVQPCMHIIITCLCLLLIYSFVQWWIWMLLASEWYVLFMNIKDFHISEFFPPQITDEKSTARGVLKGNARDAVKLHYGITVPHLRSQTDTAEWLINKVQPLLKKGMWCHLQDLVSISYLTHWHEKAYLYTIFFRMEKYIHLNIQDQNMLSSIHGSWVQTLMVVSVLMSSGHACHCQQLLLLQLRFVPHTLFVIFCY